MKWRSREAANEEKNGLSSWRQAMKIMAGDENQEYQWRSAVSAGNRPGGIRPISFLKAALKLALLNLIL